MNKLCSCFQPAQQRGEISMFRCYRSGFLPFQGEEKDPRPQEKKPCIFPHFSPLKIACGVISEKNPSPSFSALFPPFLFVPHAWWEMHLVFHLFCVSRKCGKMHAVRSFYFNAQRYAAEVIKSLPHWMQEHKMRETKKLPGAKKGFPVAAPGFPTFSPYQHHWLPPLPHLLLANTPKDKRDSNKNKRLSRAANAFFLGGMTIWYLGGYQTLM